MLLMLQSAPPAPPPEEEILVLSRKMRLIEVDIKAPRRRGKLVLERCRVTNPTGRPELDAIPCEAARACMLDNPATRKQLSQCVEDKAQVRLDAVVAAWRTAA
ncbi:hypothetical protein FHS95_001641 [Sphingomonas naasensis]|uniref:Uncharacterized protein n=1 Tax=Sphingomonas naasensis TaxID=1344951 RepID=A0A4S1W9E0_9SPHN|nr:hypothetical protein [Sphingomonas naasensis]NIJ19972.1 hypothetical protein [Sphingomonas naasensis]TGX37927.1 hypothetical protein E5A74_19335 [Sphingomonas naasensis]